MMHFEIQDILRTITGSKVADRLKELEIHAILLLVDELKEIRQELTELAKLEGERRL